MHLGDLVVGIDDRTSSPPMSFFATLEECEPGEGVTLAIVRDGEAVSVPLKPGEEA
jgi:S1-C subfamily serine protease